MVSWIVMIICNIFIPIIMIIVGNVFMKHPPKTINGAYGYRTTMSRKNMDTWNFAHLYCGKLWWIVGWIMLPVSVIVMLPLLGKDGDVVGIFGAVISVLECIILLATIIPVEIALAKKFDKDGNRR